MIKIQSSRSTILFAGALSTGAILASACGSSEPSGDVAKGPARGSAVRLEANQNRFLPVDLQLPAGREVTIEIRNEDQSEHDFAIESLGINTGIIEKGEVATATFIVPDRPIEFECTLHGGMKGVIEPR